MSERLLAQELKNRRREEKGTIRILLGRGHASEECEHAAGMTVEVPRVMAPTEGLKKGSES